MKVALAAPRPYLLNRAGGIVKIESFSLLDGDLHIAAISDTPVTGLFQLVYRCGDHEHFDVKRDVSSDGTAWSLVDQLPQDEDCDVCYPEPCS